MHNMATLCIRLQPLWLSYKIQKNRAVEEVIVLHREEHVVL
jgi:hypothetical protein